MADLADLGMKIAEVAGTAVIGFVAGKLSVVGKISAIQNSLLSLAENVKNLKNDDIKNIKDGFRLELDNHYDDVKEKFDRLERELEEHQRFIDSWRDSKADYAKEAALAKFMMEVTTRWETISGVLGEIRGEMRRVRESQRPNMR